MATFTPTSDAKNPVRSAFGHAVGRPRGGLRLRPALLLLRVVVEEILYVLVSRSVRVLLGPTERVVQLCILVPVGVLLSKLGERCENGWAILERVVASTVYATCGRGRCRTRE